MKIAYPLIAAATLAFAASAVQAHDDGYKRGYRSSYNNTSPNAVHTGGMTAEDQALADEVAAALRADPRMNGATVTVTARNGRVTLSGTAKDIQSEIAQRDAKDIAGAGHVIGFLSPGAG